MGVQQTSLFGRVSDGDYAGRSRRSRKVIDMVRCCCFVVSHDYFTMSGNALNYRHICTAAMIANNGLRMAHSAASQLGKGEEVPDMERVIELSSMRLMFVRHIMLEITNIADVADKSRALFKDHSDLGRLHGECVKAFDFCKYIRNKYVGHLEPELADKTFEWEPNAYHTIGQSSVGEQYFMSLFVLETAINTYVDPDTSHKIFDSETDLRYPPNEKRFYDFLGKTAEDALNFSDCLIEVTASYVEVPDMEKTWKSLAIKAGGTQFRYLAKRGR
jgi:hypothetical protein